MEEIKTYPTIFIGLGKLGSKVISKTIKRLKEGYRNIPYIFSFVTMDTDNFSQILCQVRFGNSEKIEEVQVDTPQRSINFLKQVYEKTLSIRHLNLARNQSLVIDQSSLETYLICSLCESPTDSLFIDIPLMIEDYAKRKSISGPRRAIFILSESFVSTEDIDKLEAKTISSLKRLNEAMAQPYHPFENCYFIDRFNENGLALEQEVDVTDIISEFLIHSTFSPLAKKIKEVVKPSILSSSPEEAFCSFGLINWHYNSKKVMEYCTGRLRQKIITHMLEESKKPLSEDKTTNEVSDNWIINYLEKSKVEQESVEDINQDMFDTIKVELSTEINSFFLKESGNFNSLKKFIETIGKKTYQAYYYFIRKIELIKREIVREEARLLFWKPTPIYQKSPINWALIIIGGILIISGIIVTFTAQIIGIGIAIVGLFILLLSLYRPPRQVDVTKFPSENLEKLKQALISLEQRKDSCQRINEYLDRLLIGCESLQRGLTAQLESSNQQEAKTKDTANISSAPLFIRSILNDEDINTLFLHEIRNIKEVIKKFFSTHEIIKFLEKSPGEFFSTLYTFCLDKFKWLVNENLESIIRRKLSLNKENNISKLEEILEELIQDSAPFWQAEQHKPTSKKVIIGLESDKSFFQKYFKKAHPDSLLVSTGNKDSMIVLQLIQGLPIEAFVYPRRREEKVKSKKK
jgi:hypothetical protein